MFILFFIIINENIIQIYNDKNTKYLSKNLVDILLKDY